MPIGPRGLACIKSYETLRLNATTRLRRQLPQATPPALTPAPAPSA